MEKYYYDLHIHSILSPCADILMTPNNILNMAMLKKLDFVSVTDHNSTKQLDVFNELSLSYDFVFIPGIEITVKENFDVLCYFKTTKIAIEFGDYIEDYLCDEWNGYTKENQVLTDIYDQDIIYYDKPLIKTSISYDSLVELVDKYDGLIVLAHIDRYDSSALKIYELEDIKFNGIEFQKHCNPSFINNDKYSKYISLINSDAHDLISISEKESYFELEAKTIDAFFKYMRPLHE